MNSSFDLYQALLHNNMRIAANFVFPWSPGHMIGELDNLLRMIRLGEIPEDSRCLVPVANHLVTNAIAEIYGPAIAPKVTYINNNALYIWAREIARACPEMVCDPSIGHTRYALTKKTDYRLMPFQDMLHYQVTNNEVVQSNIRWHERRSKTMDYQPLSHLPPPDEDLCAFLGGDLSKIALVHLRSMPTNSATITEPQQFYPTLEYLRDCGYVIVFVSREQYPEEFNRFGVKNYAQSSLACFSNDLKLFKMAKIAVISGAGISALAQIMDTPYVWGNSWGISMMCTGSACVWLPTLLQDKLSGRYFTFSEQIDYFNNRPESWDLKPEPYSPVYGNPWRLVDQEDKLHLREPAPDELRDAVIETLRIAETKAARNELQERFSSLNKESCMLSLAEGRISSSFIEKFKHLL